MPHINLSGSPLLPSANLIAAGVVSFMLLLALIFLLIHFNNKRLLLAHKIRELLVWAMFVVASALIFGAFELLAAPKVVSVSPSPGSGGVDSETNITISFNRPVSRRVLEKTISPEVPGTWVFEDPVYATHFYRRLVFYPDTTLNAGIKYSVDLVGIQNTLRTAKPYNLNFSFGTKADPIVTKAITKIQSETFKLSVPSFIQQHTLSCEVASLRMALAYKGINKSEDELLNQVGFDNTPHVDGTWGNPYEHFVGNVDGNQMQDGYGVYWGPIERVAKNYGGAQAFQNQNIKFLTSQILNGNPVVIWVYSKSGAPTHWKTPSGVDVFAVAGEHTVVAVGFVGSANDPTQVIVNDSLVGQVYWPRSYFDHKWATFSQSGVVIFK